MLVRTTILTGLLTLGLAAGAQAAPPAFSSTETVSVKVPLADLNLRRTPGARIALQRISSAARDICGNPANLRLDSAARSRACSRETVDRAVVTLDNPIVTALNAQRTAPATLMASRR